MIAALIVAGVVTYAIIGGVVGGFVHDRLTGSNRDIDSFLLGLVWPLSIFVLAGAKAGSIISKGLRG